MEVKYVEPHQPPHHSQVHDWDTHPPTPPPPTPPTPTPEGVSEPESEHNYPSQGAKPKKHSGDTSLANMQPPLQKSQTCLLK